MADVQYVLEVTKESVPNKTDAVIATAMAAVDITPVLQERADDFTLCADVTAIDSPGVVQRTITAELTAGFESRNPNLNAQLRALRNAFGPRFGKLLPSRVSESVSVGAFCP